MRAAFAHGSLIEADRQLKSLPALPDVFTRLTVCFEDGGKEPIPALDGNALNVEEARVYEACADRQVSNVPLVPPAT